MTTAGETIGAPKTLRKIAFAKHVGVTPGRVSQYIKEGMPVEPDGRIDVARGEQWIKANVSPTRSAAQSAQSDLPFAAQRDAAEERIRLVREQADREALKNQRLRGELVPAADVERAWSNILRQVRSAVLAVPSRVRQQLPHLTAHDIATFDAEIRRALEDLANAH
jgi:phage terminase Nu1 subunit (DNA packaging protein)